MSDPIQQSDAQKAEEKARRGRNIATALGLVIFVVLVFIVTIVKMKGNVVERPF